MAGENLPSGPSAADVHKGMNQSREFAWCCPGYVFSAVAHFSVDACKADCDARYPHSELPGRGCNTFGKPWISGPAGFVKATRVRGIWIDGDVR